MNPLTPSSPGPRWPTASWIWRAALLAAVWGLVAAHVAAEFGGRSARLWHYDLREFYHVQSAFYEGVFPRAGGLSGTVEATGLRSEYPPSSFFLFAPWIPPGLGWARIQIWFVLCQAAACGALGWLAWRYSRGTRGLTWLPIGGILAMTGLRADIVFGNYALLMTAMLVLLCWAAENNRPVWSVVALTESMMKPQMGWLFAVHFMRGKGWRILLFVCGLLVALAVAACIWTNVSLLDSLGFGFSDTLASFPTVASRHSLVTVLVQFGAPARLALVGLGIVGAVGSFVALNGRLAGADVLTRFAFLGLVNRTFTYHNTCDDLLLVFALVLLGRRAWHGNKAAAWAAFLLLGATVWAPSMLLTQSPIRILVIAVWIGLAIAIWRHERPGEALANS